MPELLKLKKSNCKNCYKCIRNCPVKSIKFSGNQAHVIGNECILCGRCFVVCPQGAKEIADDTEKVTVMIGEGRPVYVSLAPSFVANYPGAAIESMRAALTALGFAGVEETAVGATVVKREYERLLSEGARDILISSCCHSVNILIQKYYPSLLPYLADVVSPMGVHCADIKRRHPDAQTVFIGPCVAKKDEADRYPDGADAVLTFEELSSMLAQKGIEIGRSDKNDDGYLARFFPTSGGILKTMTKRDDYKYIAVDGAENCIAVLEDIKNGEFGRCFIEMSICASSCVGGPVMEKHGNLPIRNYLAVANYSGKTDFDVAQPSAKELHKSIQSIDMDKRIPSEGEIAAALRQMGKTKPEDELNCGSCGYNTCREKAVAVAQGKANISMCLPFLTERAENFSDIIIQNTPNAILVVNEQLEVQQLNKSALGLMNIRRESDVLGEPVVRILDPKVFMDVCETGRGVYEKPAYLAEYKKYVEQTVVADNDSHVLICLMRDVTDEVNERLRKEELSRKTAAVADKVVEKQMRIVQDIASLLGETAAETKIVLTKLKESMSDEQSLR